MDSGTQTAEWTQGDRFEWGGKHHVVFRGIDGNLGCAPVKKNDEGEEVFDVGDLLSLNPLPSRDTVQLVAWPARG